MITADDISEIQRHSPFSLLRRDSLEGLVERVTRKTLKANTPVYYQGEPSKYFYLVNSGVVKLSRITPNGNEKVIDIVEAGEYMAETGVFIHGLEHVATASTVTDCQIFSFPCGAFKQILQSDSGACLPFLNMLSLKLFSSVLEIESLAMSKAISRVASYCVQKTAQSEVRSFRIPVQKQLLASRLSIQPETLSRVFSRLKDDKMLEINGNEVVIHNIEALKKKYLALQ